MSELIDKELQFFENNVEGYWWVFVHLLTNLDEELYTCDDEELICSEE